MLVFVGYDSREHCCWQVLEFNLKRWGHDVYPIKHRELRAAGKFSREWFTEADGQWVDRRDGKPFSTEFSHSRFAAFMLAREMGVTDWCMFVDCDFLFLSDPAHLLNLVDERHSLGCVQYKWDEPEGDKMDGMVQLRYYRKLWSSLFLFKPDHPDHKRMTWHKLNFATGAELHAFDWVRDDRSVAQLPESWNWIPDFSDPDIEPNAIHWSYGGPWMEGFEQVAHASKWRLEWHQALQYMAAKRVALNPLLVSKGRIR